MKEYFIALGAGMATFFSPCVLPLIPGYLSIISGVSAGEILKGENDSLHKKVFYSSLFFTLGFSLVFSILGATASAVGSLLAQNKALFQKIMGALLFLLGVHMTGLINIKWLNYEKRAAIKPENKNYFSAFLIGAGFAFGWSPCIGPFLGGILLMAATKAAAKGALMLFLYSVGLGIPFLAAGLASASFFKFISSRKNLFRRVELVSGIILAALGVLLFFDKLFLE
ncbi:MAG: cytochrome C biogenesis protein [Elusimicrobia bacterium CG08_land_8_20_14_0_20_51_18]|nr:MAG: cytochrome C biogenesis protein [Elusimicrobia bacterium CG08_land_8_20_14_0_20_51_18]